MAVVELTKVEAPFNAITKATPVAGHTDGVTYVLADHDESMILVVRNVSADTNYDLTVKAPANKIWTSAETDVVLEIPFGDIAVVPLESAKFLDVTTGKITLDVEHASLQFAVFQIG